ncbi:MAG TPA: acetylglutamate kinase [Polyangiaceae bacterium]|nr:acetylglutamate kinase [Polyangiaceae bacterium]
MRDIIEKAAVLHEALPYIRRFHGKTFVLKYGGHAMVDEKLREGFARDVALLKYVGIHPVVVHGGGPQIDQVLAKMGVVSERIEGLRVTDEHTMEVVEMVLAGQVNSDIVSSCCAAGARAVGLSGKDDGFIVAQKVTQMRTKSGTVVDPGRVGDVVRIKRDIVDKLVDGGFVPVVAPIAVDDAGASLNVNADYVASRLAAALGAEKLVLMTDVEGVRGRDGALAGSLDRKAVTELIDTGIATGGMIPKLRCALEAIAGGVKKVHVIDGRTEHAVLLEIFTDRGVGTEIVA